MRKVIVFISFLFLLQTTLSVNLVANTDLLTVISDGSGFIEGYVVNADENLNIEYVKVELLDENNQIVSNTFTDENGFYQLENINFGNYKLQVKIVDKISEQFAIAITTDEISYSGLDFEIRESEVVVAMQSTIIEELLEHDIILTPNPTLGNSSLLYDSRVATDGELTIVNTSGNVIYSRTYNLVRGENTIFIPSIEFESGIYYVTLKIGKKKHTELLIKL